MEASGGGWGAVRLEEKVRVNFTEEVTFVWGVRGQRGSFGLEKAQLAGGTARAKAQRHVTGTASHCFGLRQQSGRCVSSSA